MSNELRRWMRLVEAPLAEAVSPKSRFLYHATVSTHLPAIFRQGLQPNTDRESNWNFDDSPKGVTFLADTPKQARYYGKIAVRADPSAFIVLMRIVRNTMDAEPDTGSPGDYHTRSAIPPAALEVFWRGAWAPLLSQQALVDQIEDD